jgi:hypothetical protein
MTDRSILFSTEMVRAILDGRKTQTRRVMKVQPCSDELVTVEHYHLTVIDRHGDMQPGKEIFGAHWNDGEQGLRCPYGAPGDTLWVREAHAISANPDLKPWYRLDHEEARSLGPRVDVKWRPSIHMPRWASRITLRITDVRVERLQDVTEDDARAEGCDPVVHPDGAVDCGTRKTTFAKLWNKINGPGAWGDNPWVWVISFERVKP